MKKSSGISKLSSKIAVMAIISMSILAASCNSKKKVASVKYTLNLARSVSETAGNPLILISKANNFYADNGLELQFTGVERAGATEAVSIGKMDGQYLYLVPPLAEGGQGANITILAGSVSGGKAVLARKEVVDKLRNVNDWKGARIGLKLYAIPDMIIKSALSEDYGFDLEKDVEFKYYDGDESTVAALQKGLIDVGTTSSSYVEVAKSLGVEYLFPLTKLKPNYVCCRQSVNTKRLEEDREAFKILVKGEILAYKTYETDEKLAVSIFSSAIGQTEEWTYDYLYNTKTNQEINFNPDPNYNGTLGVYTILQNSGYIENGRPLNEFFNIELYAEVLKEVIAENPNDPFYKDMWSFFVKNNNKYPNFSSTYSSTI